MDLRTVAAVIGRHRTVTAIGVVLAFGLAFLAAYRLDASKFPPLERRQAATYESTSRLFVTQEGFPWGRSSLRYTTDPGQPPTLEGDPTRFAELAVLYAQLANSDRVLGNLGKDKDRVLAKVVTVSQFSSAPLPLIDITGKADDPRRSRSLARTTVRSLVDFIAKSQATSRIPPSERVVLEVIDPARLGKMVNGPSPALPAIVFLTVLLVTLGAVFARDNWLQGRTAAPAPVAAEEPLDRPFPRIAPTDATSDDEAPEQPSVRTVAPSRWASASGRPVRED
jgi:hypothetical protein